MFIAFIILLLQFERSATYQGPNLALHEMLEYVREGRLNYLVQFGEAARADLAHRR